MAAKAVKMRMSLIGIVTKVGVMAKTSTVTVTRFLEHPVTRKRIMRSKKYLAHDPNLLCQLEDRVLIRHCNPVSARKNFVLEEILDSPRSRTKSNPSTSSDAAISSSFVSSVD